MVFLQHSAPSPKQILICCVQLNTLPKLLLGIMAFKCKLFPPLSLTKADATPSRWVFMLVTYSSSLCFLTAFYFHRHRKALKGCPCCKDTLKELGPNPDCILPWSVINCLCLTRAVAKRPWPKPHSTTINKSTSITKSIKKTRPIHLFLLNTESISV